MDSRLFYTVFRYKLKSIAWSKHGGNEYVLIGDGIDIDLERLQSLISKTFNGPTLCFPASRSETLEMPVQSAASFIADRLRPKETVTVSDPAASVFLQVHSMGVARTGRSQANNSFKGMPLRGTP